jgi:hypothetical protein
MPEVAEAKRRGRPKKQENPVEPLTPSTAERYLKQIRGDKLVEIAIQEGDYERLVERYRPMMEAALKWEAQTACPACHARPGYNPITGIRVRSWDDSEKKWIDGHRQNCLTLAKPAR